MSNRAKAIEILKDYYGENRIDCQEDTILIYWPEVTVTNEYDRSTLIKELYAKIRIDEEGKLIGTFTLNRAEYTCTEWFNNYMHSHVRTIPKQSLTTFQNSCLGSGPIRDTMNYLNTTFSVDLWMMFSLELDKYVHTESIEGIPYKRMEEMNMLPDTGYNEVPINLDGITPISIPETFKEYISVFIHYIIDKKEFSFTFNERYSIGDSKYNILVKMSNMFIEWFNNSLCMDNTHKRELMYTLFNDRFLIRCKASEGNIKELRAELVDYREYRNANGAELWIFKGNLLRLKITGIPSDEELHERTMNIYTDRNLSTFINPCYVHYIVKRILNIVNYEYGRAEEETRPDKKVFYL